MLALDSPRWRELAQAHGSAEDIPRLLEVLEALATTGDVRVRAELRFGILATLCPHGRPDDAAYAAVPHPLARTRDMTAEDRGSAVHVATVWGRSRRVGGSAPLPDALVPAVGAAHGGRAAGDCRPISQQHEHVVDAVAVHAPRSGPAFFFRARFDPELVDLDVPVARSGEPLEQRPRARQDRAHRRSAADGRIDRLEPTRDAAVEPVY